MDKRQEKIIDHIGKEKGYEIALMTTYTFDVEYFERAVLNRLIQNDVRSIAVFVDAKQLGKSIRYRQSYKLGKRYSVNPIPMNASFHPKIILLIAKNKAKLIVASANLTTSGYEQNHEVFNSITYSKQSPINGHAIMEAFRLFQELNNISYRLDSTLISKAQFFLNGIVSDKRGERQFLHNFTQPILNQIVGIVGSHVKEIHVAVPYYDNRLSALETLHSRYPNAKIELYIQNKTSSFPAKSKRKEELISKIHIFQGFNDGKENAATNFYHGKVFAFKQDKDYFMVYGSANCTNAALCKSYKDGGNIEGCFIEKCDENVMQNFFSRLDYNDDLTEQLESTVIHYDEDAYGIFHFKYGHYKDGLSLFLGYTQKVNPLKVFVEDVAATYRYSEEDLIICLDADKCQSISAMPLITLCYGDNSEELQAWAIFEDDLSYYRLYETSTKELTDFEPEGDENKYIIEAMNLMNSLSLCGEEIDEYNKIASAIRQTQAEIDTIEEDDDDILDYDISDGFRDQYKNFEIIKYEQEHVLNLLTKGRLFSMRNEFLIQRNNSHTESDSNKKNDPKTEGKSRSTRERTTAEKRFARFVKIRNKGFHEKHFIEIIDLDRFLGAAAVFLNIYDRYMNITPVEGMFESDYVIKKRVEILLDAMEIYSRSSLNSQSQWKQTLLELGFTALLYNHDLIERAFSTFPDKKALFEQRNRQLLVRMDELFRIRAHTKDWVYNIFDGQREKGLSQRKQQYVAYLEKTIGYKSDGKLVEFIEKKYHGQASVSFDKTTARISITTDIDNDTPKRLSDLLAEVRKYSRESQRLSTIIVDIVNARPLIKKESVLHVEHRVSVMFREGKISTIKTMTDGSRKMENAKHIRF